MLEQFTDRTGIKLPDNITARLGFDEQEDINARQAYIWNELRFEWIDFYAWRWEKFWKKVASALHAHGKKVMINNAWCSDPFEALFRYGIDYKRLYAAGVDIIVAETVPEGLELVDCTRDLFRRLMSAAQLMSAYSPEGKLLTLLGVKDCTEEWDMLHHAPMRLERDMYMLGAIYRQKGNEFTHSTSGYMITLGDGITKDEYSWIGEREKVAFTMAPKTFEAATIIWSDKGHHACLKDYINSRRPSTHEIIYRLENSLSSIGAAARIEDIASLDGVLLVPNFDLLPEDEKKAVVAYKKAAVVCITSKEFMDNTDIKFDFCIEDKYANYKLCAAVLNHSFTDEEKAAIISAMDGGEKVCDPAGEPRLWIDPPFFTTPILFAGISKTFLKACKLLLDTTKMSIFRSEHSIIPVKLDDNLYRVYILNPIGNYVRAQVFCDKTVVKVDNISKYPLMPSKLIAPIKTAGAGDGAKAHLMQVEDPNAKAIGFIGKVPPVGISIFDVTVE